MKMMLGLLVIKQRRCDCGIEQDRKSTRLNSSHANISYAVFCLKKNKHSGEHQPPHEPHSRPVVDTTREDSPGARERPLTRPRATEMATAHSSSSTCEPACHGSS